MATNSYGWASPSYPNSNNMSSPSFDPFGGFTGSGPTVPNQGGGVPSGAPFNMPSQQGNSFLDTWYNKYGAGSPIDFGKKEQQDIAEEFATGFAVPYQNAMLAQRQQQMNEAFGGWDRNEQQRMNTFGMGLQGRSADREDRALQFGMDTNYRDFGEGQRQFNQQFGLEQEMGRGRLALDQTIAQQQNQLGQGRLSLDNRVADMQNRQAQEQARIANFEAQTGRIDVEGRNRLQQFANETARMGVQNEYNLGNRRFGLEQELGRGRLGLDTELGRGQLGFQNRELDVNDAYRRQALGQEAELSRERMQNDLTQSRYAAFGRAQQPNFRAAQSWY